jgi:hypothetical protein
MFAYGERISMDNDYVGVQCDVTLGDIGQSKDKASKRLQRT